MSVPPQPPFSLSCVRGTTETLSFYYKDSSGNPIVTGTKTLSAKFTTEPGGTVAFEIVPTWDDSIGLITLGFTTANTTQDPGDYTADIHVIDTGSDVVILRVKLSITPSYP
jgi:hypothetical protein